MTVYNHWTGPTLLVFDTSCPQGELSITSIANEFVSCNPSRMNIFEKLED